MSLKKWSVILLIIQCFTVFFGVFALTDPFLLFKKNEPYGILFLIDNTASMNKSGKNENTKLESAKKILAEELSKIKNQKFASIYTFNSELSEISKPTKNYKSLISKIKKIKPSFSFYDEQKINNSLIKFLAGQSLKFEAVILTDGTSTFYKLIEKTFNGNISFINVENKNPNMGISGLRITADGKIFFTIINSNISQIETDISLLLGDETIDNFRVNIKPGNNFYSLPLRNKPAAGNYKIRINNNDLNDYDNESNFSLNAPYKVNILFAGEENIFIRSFFENDLFELSFTKNFNNKSLKDYTAYDFIISDNEKIDLSMNNNIIYFAPKEDKNFSNKKISGVISASSENKAFTRYINNYYLFADNALILKTGTDTQTIFHIDNNPVAIFYDKKKFLKVIFGFTIYSSNLAITEAFPILLNNVIRYKIPQWDNPNAFNYINDKEYSIYYNLPFKNINNKNFKALKKGNYIYIKTSIPGNYSIKLKNKIYYFSSNIDISELDSTPKFSGNPKNTNQILTDSYEKEKLLKKLFIFLFIIFLAAEWFLWNTNLITGKKR